MAAPAPPERAVAVGTGVLGTAVFGATVANTKVAVATGVDVDVGVAVCTGGGIAVQVGWTWRAAAPPPPPPPPHGVAVAGPAVDVAVGVVSPASAREPSRPNDAPSMIVATVTASTPVLMDLFDFSLLLSVPASCRQDLRLGVQLPSRIMS
jgi:hypothetical protein